MNDAELDRRVATLRAAFDGSFAEPPPAIERRTERFLAIEIAGTAYAVAQVEAAALYVDRPIAELPSMAATCLGVTTLNGELVPVHSLALLLGHGAAEGTPRWTMRVAGSVLGLAFDRLEGQLRVTTDAITALQPGASTPLIAACITTNGITRPIVRVHEAIAQLETGIREE